MGTNFNFKNFGNDPPSNGGGGGRPPMNYPLARQGSIYSLTFDELQSTIGSTGKDFGSMNMDELLKNIWTAEETQTMAIPPSGAGGPQGVGVSGGYLQRQGSLTLPRTMSQKTVDQVWRDISNVGNDGSGTSGFNLEQRQQTLGEMTLEEFLVKAGVVREDAQLMAKSGNNNNGFLGDLLRSNNNNTNTGLGFGFQQTGQNMSLMSNRIPETNNQISIQSSNLPLNVNGVRSSQQQLPSLQPQQLPSPQPQQQPQIFPKQAGMSFATPMPFQSNAQLGAPRIRDGVVGISERGINSNLVHGTGLQAGGMGMVGLGPGAVTVGTGSPANQISSDGVGKSNGDTSSVSPVPYAFNGGMRGRRSGGAVEKVVERRQRRMIKNRESAARSRARKQAYTMELETEVAKLKEENENLQKKQAEIMELQKIQVLEIMNVQQGAKKRCLRRTQTGPW